MNALRYGETQKARDFQAGNEFADRLVQLGATLRSSAEGQASLMSLLRHDDAYVRVWAAKDCLAFAPEIAVPVLELIEAGKGLLGTAARMTLTEWRAGRLFRG